MKSTVTFLLLLCSTLGSGYAQLADAYAIQTEATIQTSPDQITIRWNADVGTLFYTISKKLKTDAFWSVPLDTFNVWDDTVFVDTNVIPGESYEYRLYKERWVDNVIGYGYINAGIEIPLVESRGKMILVVDNTHSTALQVELEMLEKDLDGDGWEVIRYDVSPTDSVPYVRSLIQDEYNADPAGVRSVFLFGHVPVPYSGNMAPDGHVPDHFGAWPADPYYGIMGGVWTDVNVNSTSATYARNHNVPGDGKFDQTVFPANLDLQVGRVDFYDLPVIATSEEELLRRYIVRNHNYRHKVFSPQYRGLVDDDIFGNAGGEAFSAVAWKSFPPLLGRGNTSWQDYISTLSVNSYIWSYGCGPGDYDVCTGVGNSSDLAADSAQTIFTAMLGSYFGDWDTQDNFMRAALAQGTTLTNCWAGRPHWQFHHMGLGENIGYSSRLSQDNFSLYHANNSQRRTHQALLGDPSLRMYMMAPPTNVVATTNGHHVDVSWIASTDSVLGYHVYRKDSNSWYTRVNQQLIAGTSFTDTTVVSEGELTYLVRAMRLEETPSGSFYNMSQGNCDTTMSGIALDLPAIRSLFTRMYPNPTNSHVTLEVNHASGAVRIELLSATGQRLFERMYNTDERITFVVPGSAGLYFVRVVANDGVQKTLQLLKR